MVDGDKDGSFF